MFCNFIQGLVNVIKELGQHVEHHVCVRHLYNNFRKRHHGAQLKEMMWQAIRATTIPEFKRIIQKMKETNGSDWKELDELQASSWTKSTYGSSIQCDL